METLEAKLKRTNKKWLVTGAAGFIGSHLVEELVKNNQSVIAIDNFITGRKENLSHISSEKFKFIEGDLCDLDFCQQITKHVDIILHQAALGSVPRSIENPLNTHKNNVDASVNLLWASVKNKVTRYIFASSSSVYGDNLELPKVEERIGTALSPYALTKQICEDYALNFSKVYGLEVIGLRYFNVFGARQNKLGPYAAVIPKWISALISGEIPQIYGDGETSRDFCYVKNVVQANLLAGTTSNKEALNKIYNIALNQKTSLNDIYKYISQGLYKLGAIHTLPNPQYLDFRAGDIHHSQADIAKAQKLLRYHPHYFVQEGINLTLKSWWQENVSVNIKFESHL